MSNKLLKSRKNIEAKIPYVKVKKQCHFPEFNLTFIQKNKVSFLPVGGSIS